MHTHHRPHRLPRTAALLLLAAAGFASAQGIVVQDLRDTSSALPDIDGQNLDLRFSSRAAALPPTLEADRAGLQLRFSWSFGALTDTFPTPHEFHRRLGWSVTLQVQDPLNRGFELRLDSELRGLVAADEDMIGIASATLPALDIWFYEAFAATPRRLGELGSPEVHADAGMGLDRVLVDQAGRATVGRYRGTQSFLFYLEPAASAALDVASFHANVAHAYAWLQFGRGTSESQMAFMNPLPSEPALDTLGQFINFRVDYAAAPVPEPTTWLLLAGGAGFMMLRRRRLA
jgi:PEP-CTERM motif